MAYKLFTIVISTTTSVICGIVLPIAFNVFRTLCDSIASFIGLKYLLNLKYEEGYIMLNNIQSIIIDITHIVLRINLASQNALLYFVRFPSSYQNKIFINISMKKTHKITDSIVVIMIYCVLLVSTLSSSLCAGSQKDINK